MIIVDWSHAAEVKELYCGVKPIVVQCTSMGCSCVGYYPDCQSQAGGGCI